MNGTGGVTMRRFRSSGPLGLAGRLRCAMRADDSLGELPDHRQLGTGGAGVRGGGSGGLFTGGSGALLHGERGS